jgi:hypothetical protein
MDSKPFEIPLTGNRQTAFVHCSAEFHAIDSNIPSTSSSQMFVNPLIRAICRQDAPIAAPSGIFWHDRQLFSTRV